ncbi:GntR family transcriptional regulator [Clostridium novyi]|uniref:Transcriptional regulator, GntR family n=1 Tax=Clostridium novyi (strain NT) TaxID=386415 RepID=A0Q3P3_CLONN|nr:GntR family transcriptional regulator [Clostridium novyi]ABK62647.1 transcriptional regulator, GntR family [Clostridium novyi NT]KEH84897.1 GntR family transcriptional regulator [Clostridium novyi A str. NCTC 538]KEH85031.1 GntR family transcriptional regulator [Clostridium novyi A str. 4540]
MNIKFDEKIPIYVQVMDIIKKDIISGKLKKGDKLSSVRDLSEKLKVNPNTVQRAYKELERENLAYTQRGMGTFIVEDVDIINDLKRNTAKDIMKKFIESMRSLGFEDEEIIDLVIKSLKGEK